MSTQQQHNNSKPEDLDSDHKPTNSKTFNNESNSKSKPPNPPKRPLTSYFIFQSENREAVAQKFPNENGKYILTHISEAWRHLADEKKKTYEAKAGELRKQYEEKKKQYEEEHGAIPNHKRRADKDSPGHKTSTKKSKVSQSSSKKKPSSSSLVSRDNTTSKSAMTSDSRSATQLKKNEIGTIGNGEEDKEQENQSLPKKSSRKEQVMQTQQQLQGLDDGEAILPDDNSSNKENTYDEQAIKKKVRIGKNKME
jgi:high mobility group protein B3